MVKKLGGVAVIGAGLSGLSCAQALQSAGVDVRVFETTNAVGGRCATQLWQGHLVDLGVQYFTAQSGEFKKELLTRLRQFRPIISPIFDAGGQIMDDPPAPRFYVLQGNNYFAHVLSLGLNLRLNTPVETVHFRSAGIDVQGITFRAVVSALPGPLTARLFGLTAALPEYDPALVALLEYSGTNLGKSRECYGRVFPESAEPIRSSFSENNKVGRVVGSKTVFVVQAGRAYSRKYADEPPDTYLPELVRQHEEIWEIPAGNNTASYGHCWTYGRPTAPLPSTLALPRGGFICGDARAESHVEACWLDGQKTAREVLAYLTKVPA